MIIIDRNAAGFYELGLTLRLKIILGIQKILFTTLFEIVIAVFLFL